MPGVNMISEHTAILVAEELLTQGFIRLGAFRARVELVQAIMQAGEIEIGAPFIPRGRYEDWFEEE